MRWVKVPGWIVAFCIVLFISAIMSMAMWGGVKTECASVPWYRLPGCSMAFYENLSGGLIAAGGALFAGWLAWSAVREQVEIERAKLRAADIAGQSARADQVSKAVAELTTIANEGQMLLLRIREQLLDPTPDGQYFPTSPGSWISTLTGDRIWNTVTRMRSIAENLKDELDRERGMGHNAIKARYDVIALQAVTEFNSEMEAVRTMLNQQQGWLADENKRLTDLRKATA